MREAQDAPQVITVRGQERAVVLSPEAYRRLTRPGDSGLRTFLQSSPWADVDLELERTAEDFRDVGLDEDAAP